MSKIMEWNEIVEEIDLKKYRKKNTKLFVDCIYKNKAFASNKKNDVLPTLMSVENTRGFRTRRNVYNKEEISYVVLLTTNKDVYWQDFIDEELGMCVYYGDNKEAGFELHSKKGNRLLKEVFRYVQSTDIETRKKISFFSI